MKVWTGSAQLVCSRGARCVNVCVTFSDARWCYEALLAGREQDASPAERGSASTWAEAYRRAMRAAERLLRVA